VWIWELLPIDVIERNSSISVYFVLYFSLYRLNQVLILVFFMLKVGLCSLNIYEINIKWEVLCGSCFVNFNSERTLRVGSDLTKLLHCR